MPRETPDHFKYAQMMLSRSYGLGLYLNYASNRLRPAQYGYFTESGNWSCLGTFAEPEHVRENENPQDWQGGVCVSKDSYSEGSLSVSGLVVDYISAGFKLNRTRVDKAICIPEEVKENYIEHRHINDWYSQRVQSLVEDHHRAIDKYSVWFITNTLVTQKAAVSVKRAHSEGYLMDARANVPNVGGIELSAATWSSSLSDHSTINRQAEPQKVVIFVKGVQYIRAYRWQEEEVREGKLSAKMSKSSSNNILRKKGLPKDKNQPNQNQSKQDPSRSENNNLTGFRNIMSSSEIKTSTVKGTDGQWYIVEYKLWGVSNDIFSTLAPVQPQVQGSTTVAGGNSYPNYSSNFDKPTNSTNYGPSNPIYKDEPSMGIKHSSTYPMYPAPVQPKVETSTAVPGRTLYPNNYSSSSYQSSNSTDYEPSKPMYDNYYSQGIKHSTTYPFRPTPAQTDETKYALSGPGRDSAPGNFPSSSGEPIKLVDSRTPTPD